ncbi:MAG: MarR family transcriptional regulator [Candidatus Dadabacteria bacterium]|nr:MAG: MarR family transcriptional regulator [Candidatus Dadabacteria bacterium]
MQRQTAVPGAATVAPGEHSPGPVELAIVHELGGLLTAIFKHFVSDVVSDTRYGATPSQLRFLEMLSINPGLSVVEAARRLAITTPSACTALGRLCSLGWVEKRPDPSDRRSFHLYLTREGWRVVRDVQEMQIARLRRLLERFRPEEIESFRDMVRRISDAIDELYG